MNSFVLIIIITLFFHYIITYYTSHVPQLMGNHFELDLRQRDISIRMKDKGAFFCGDCKSHRNLLGSYGEEIPCYIDRCDNRSGVGINDEIHHVKKFIDLERIF